MLCCNYKRASMLTLASSTASLSCKHGCTISIFIHSHSSIIDNANNNANVVVSTNQMHERFKVVIGPN